MVSIIGVEVKPTTLGFIIVGIIGVLLLTGHILNYLSEFTGFGDNTVGDTYINFAWGIIIIFVALGIIFAVILIYRIYYESGY